MCLCGLSPTKDGAQTSLSHAFCKSERPTFSCMIIEAEPDERQCSKVFWVIFFARVKDQLFSVRLSGLSPLKDGARRSLSLVFNKGEWPSVFYMYIIIILLMSMLTSFWHL